MGRSLPEEFRNSGPAPTFSVSVLGLEVVQAVQEPGNSVALVAGKHTLVRVYLDTNSPAPIAVRGTLRLLRQPPATDVQSINAATLDPALNGDLEAKRNQLAASLNFYLPAGETRAGRVALTLQGVQNSTTGAALSVVASPATMVEFLPGPPLRLRLLGVRYPFGNPPKPQVPRKRDIDLVLSWLRRAYPVPSVDMSYTVVDAPPGWLPSDTSGLALNPYIAAIRNKDMEAGGDQRTHYFGLVYDADGNTFMRGWAAGMPQQPDPSVVACGPAGAHFFSWDTDGSYGDWYTGHELAHTFGRFHPGFCPNNSSDDPHFPYPSGQISGDSPAYHGYDKGDASNGIPEAILPGTQWHDLMTYCDNQWLSAYTYEAIRVRLVEEDALGPGAGAGGGPSPAAFLPADAVTEAAMHNVNVVATLNLTQHTGGFAYVTPVALPEKNLAGAAAEVSATIRALDAQGVETGAWEVQVNLDSCRDPGEDRTGMVDAILPLPTGTAALQLVLDGEVLDTFRPGPPVAPVASIRAQPAMAAAPTIAWESAQADNPAVTYTVQVSADQGQSWRTISVGSPNPAVQLDASQFPGLSTVRVRVTETNGFEVADTREEEISIQ